MDEFTKRATELIGVNTEDPADYQKTIAAVAAALEEFKSEGGYEVLREIRKTMPTRDEARDLLFGPMGLHYSLINGYHDIAVDDLAFVLETQRLKTAASK